MKFRLIVAGLSGPALISSASAQDIAEDVRCVLLSSTFAKAAKDEAQRRVAAATGGFYLGRLEGKADTKALTDAVRSQMGTKMSPKDAGTLMTACAAKVQDAERTLQAIGKSLEEKAPEPTR